MSGDQIVGFKREIDRVNSEVVALCAKIYPLAMNTKIPEYIITEAIQPAIKVLQFIKDVNERAKNAYRFALEMNKLVTPDDRRPPVINNIVEVARQSLLDVSNKALKLAEKAFEIVSNIPPGANQSVMMMMLLPLVAMNTESDELAKIRDQLFKEFKILSSMYDQISSSDTMDVLDWFESEIHSRKSEMIRLGSLCDRKVWLMKEFSMDPVRIGPIVSEVVQLNEESYQLAEESRDYALRMQSFVTPGDPRAPVVTKIVAAAEKALQLSTEACELVRHVADAVARTEPSAIMMRIRSNPAMSADMSLKTNEFVKRRKALDKEYEQLSSAFRNGTPLEEARGGEQEIPLD